MASTWRFFGVPVSRMAAGDPPQYAIVAVLAGGAAYTATGSSGNTWQADALSGGLIGLLVIFAAIALLFAGRYPRGLYDADVSCS